MGLFSGIKDAVAGVFNKVKDVGGAILDTVGRVPIAKTALNVLTGGVAGSAMSMFSSGSAAVSKLFGKTSDLPRLFNSSVQGYADLFNSQSSQAKAVLASREASIQAVGDAFASAAGADLIYSDDMVFSAINKVTAGAKVGKFGFVLPRDNPAVVTGATTPYLYAAFGGTGALFDFSTASSSDMGNIGAISQRLQDDFKAFFTTQKNILELNPVITVIDKLNKLGENVDNPFDLYNFLGYEGPEVVQPLAKLDTPITNALLLRVSRHKTTKSLLQWFAAARSYSSVIATQRKVIADWLTSAGTSNPLVGFPPFLVDMLSFYILKTWGAEILSYLYNKYATKEMVASLPVASFNAMHIYDRYDRLHYMLNSAMVAFDRVHASFATAPTAEADCAKYMVCSYQVVVSAQLLFLAKILLPMTTFGLDEGDITDLYDSLTGTDTYWGDLKLLCNQDNADLLRLSTTDVAEKLATAELSCAEITILDDDDYLESVEMERFVKDLESVMATTQTMNPAQVVDAKRIVTTTIDAVREGLRNGKVADKSRAMNLIGRLQVALTTLDSKMGV